MLSVPAPTRIPLGTAQVGGQKVELFLSPEWARYFQSLNTQVQANGAALAQGAAHAALLGDATDAPDLFPAPPGPPGMQGDPGLALFMLQDDGVEQPVPGPPCVDGVYVPLNSKDARDGVPGLTGFVLNLKNVAGTITSWIVSVATAARTWTMPDKDGTLALLENFAAPPAIGGTTPAAGHFTTLDATTSLASKTLAVTTTAAVGELTVQFGFGCNGRLAQPSVPSGGPVATTAATNAAPYGFATAAQADDIVTKLNTVIATLVANGIQS
jgi:hypothetical protein